MAARHDDSPPTSAFVSSRPGCRATMPAGRRESSIVRVRVTLASRVRSWLTSRTVPGNVSSACSSCSIAGRSRWLVGSSSTRQFAPDDPARRPSAGRARGGCAPPATATSTGRPTCVGGDAELGQQRARLADRLPVSARKASSTVVRRRELVRGAAPAGRRPRPGRATACPTSAGSRRAARRAASTSPSRSAPAITTRSP